MILQLIWNKDKEILSKEEWAIWYVDDYVPDEVKQLYNMDYYNVRNVTGNWRHLYDRKR